MSFNTAKYIPTSDKQGPLFTGGIIDSIPANVLPYKNIGYGRNFRIDNYGVAIRKGFLELTTFSGSNKPFGLASYYRADDSLSRLVVGYKTDATHYLQSVTTAGVSTAIVTGANITVETRMNFVNVNDLLYCMNGTDGYGKLSGTTYTVADANFKPKFGQYFNGSMWVAGFSSSDSNKLKKSVTDDPDTWTGGDSDTLTFPEAIIGLAATNQALYVFTQTTISIITTSSIKEVSGTLAYTSIPLETNDGSAGYTSIVTAGHSVYYLTKSNKIKQVRPNGTILYDVQELTHRPFKGINNTMATLDSDQSGAFAMVIPDQNMVKWHLKTINATYNDIIVCYRWDLDEWMVDTNKIFQDGVFFKNQAYTVSGISPTLFKDEYGYTDNNAPIQFEYNKVMDFGEPFFLKELWQSRTFLSINDVASLTQEIYADGSLADTYTINNTDIPITTGGIGTTEIGTEAIGTEGTPVETMYDVAIVREKGDLQVRARRFEFRWSSGALGGRCLLQKMTPKIEMLDQLTFSDDNV